MKKIFLAAISIVCLMASCSKDEMETPAVNPLAGNEVMFTSSVGEATRTLYGEESDTGNSIAVKWVTGDLISVYGADCSLKQAEYKVTAAANATTANGMNYYYAESLDKTGETGVQWGSSGVSDFFAVYPSTPNSFKANTDGSATVKTTVRASQNVAFKKDTIKVDGQNQVLWTSQHFKGNSDNPSMTDAVMYAYTNDAVATNADGTAKAVDLKFKPFSTVLRFTMKGFQSWMKDGETETIKDSELAVNRIILTAPTGTNIAGDFNLTIKNNGNGNGTATAEAGTTNQITIYPEYLPLKNNEWVEFDVFTIPQDSVVLSKDKPWTVEVETTLGLFTYKLIPQKLVNGTLTNSDAPLTAGALHKLTIPQKKVYLGFEIPVDAWLEYIPRNVYLTELSYPGAWYFYHSDYQGNVSAQTLYDAGVRAFHIDCRLTMDDDVRVSASNEKTYYENGRLKLVAAGTDAGGSAASSGSFKQGTSVESTISGLKSLLTNSDRTEKCEEFLIVTLTIAEKPVTRSGNIYGSINPQYVMPAIETMINNLINAGVPIYNKPITPNTTVNDVLGKIVLIVNENSIDSKFTTFATPNALVSRGSIWFGESDYNFNGNIHQNSFKQMESSNLYWKNAENTTNGEMTMYFHFAQRTSENAIGNSSNSDSEYQHMAVVADRVNAVKAIATQAQEIYATGKHNAWYQICTGGYIRNRRWIDLWLTKYWDDAGEPGDAQRASITKTLNDALLEIANKKLESTENLKPSPLGIVLSNFSSTNTSTNGNTTNSLKLNQAIFNMNTKFYLNRNTEAKEWPNGSPFQDVEVDTPPSSGGDDGQLGDN